MADMGFLPSVRRLLRTIEGPRQTMLFSATISRDVERIVAEFQDDPGRHLLEATADEFGTRSHGSSRPSALRSCSVARSTAPIASPGSSHVRGSSLSRSTVTAVRPNAIARSRNSVTGAPASSLALTLRPGACTSRASTASCISTRQATTTPTCTGPAALGEPERPVAWYPWSFPSTNASQGCSRDASGPG
jgi:hypothetical protein